MPDFWRRYAMTLWPSRSALALYACSVLFYAMAVNNALEIGVLAPTHVSKDVAVEDPVLIKPSSNEGAVVGLNVGIGSRVGDGLEPTKPRDSRPLWMLDDV